jgi:hypothetical protein
VLAFLDDACVMGGTMTARSDSCAGQNKNFIMICLWQYLISTVRLQLIDHKFPESGHSFLDSDLDFALVEKQVKKRQTS